jgi:beta-galactosidase
MIYYGTAYYPEHRTKDELLKDIELMKQADFNVVRMGEFSWCRLEQQDNVFTFDWLIEAVNLLGSNGISSIICTPTAAPPIWLCEKHPEILYKDARGVVRPFGARRYYCYNSDIYRKYCERIAEKLSETLKGNPYIIGFQIDNELAQEASGRCHCDVCRGKFRNWLQKKHIDIQTLNQRFGTIFWGQEYTDFSQIEPPINATETFGQSSFEMYYNNPSLRIEFERFCSDSYIDFFKIQYAAIKRHSDKQITTNTTCFGTNSIDYGALDTNEDVFSIDMYPPLWKETFSQSSFAFSFSRNIRSNDFWILEYACGGGHALWSHNGTPQPYPGSIEQAVIFAFSSGAELITHFQFNMLPFGAEQLDGAILDLDNIPRRRYFEVADTGKTISRISNIIESTKVKRSEIAILFDYDSLWSLNIKPVHNVINHLLVAEKIYQYFVEIGCNVDILQSDKDFSAYKIVVLPTFYMLKQDLCDKLYAFTENGGTLISTFLTGIKNEHNVAYKKSFPAGLTDLFGISVSEFEFVDPDMGLEVQIETGNNTLVSKSEYWAEYLCPNGAQVLGIYNTTYHKGQAAITKNTYKNGNAYYIGSAIEKEAAISLLNNVIEENGITKNVIHGENLESIWRISESNDQYMFVYNFSFESKTVTICGNYFDILTNKKINGSVEIKPRGYLILKV